MFADTDKTLFVGRKPDGSIYGTWSVRQWVDQEEVLVDSPEVKAFLNRPMPKAGISDGELAGVLVSKGFLTQGDITTALAAKAVVELLP